MVSHRLTHHETERSFMAASGTLANMVADSKKFNDLSMGLVMDLGGRLSAIRAIATPESELWKKISATPINGLHNNSAIMGQLAERIGFAAANEFAGLCDKVYKTCANLRLTPKVVLEELPKLMLPEEMKLAQEYAQQAKLRLGKELDKGHSVVTKENDKAEKTPTTSRRDDGHSPGGR